MKTKKVFPQSAPQTLPSLHRKCNLTSVKLCANGRNNSQNCWRNNVGSCYVRLHENKRLTGFKLCATSPNNTQQHATGGAKGRNI